MAGSDKSGELKSAWEIALERLDGQGIERPREEGLEEKVRQEIAEIRKRAEAATAELEILHRDSQARATDPEAFAKAEEEYRIERRRIEEKRDSKIAALRRSGPGESSSG